MHLRGKTSIDVWDRVERLRVALGIDHAQMAELMEMTPSQYEKKRSWRASPSAASIFNLARVLHVSFERLMKGDIDYAALKAQFSGTKDVLPERYQPGAYSRVRTSRNILDFVEAHLGWEKKMEILRGVQVHESALADPEAFVNVRLISDICEEIARSHGDSYLYQIGKFSAHMASMESIRILLQGECETVSEVYDVVINRIIDKWDSNYRYDLLQLGSSGAVIVAREKEEVSDLLKERHYSSPKTCINKAGVTASLPAFLGLPKAHTEEITCVHRGDSACRFKIDFSEAAEFAARKSSFH